MLFLNTQNAYLDVAIEFWHGLDDEFESSIALILQVIDLFLYLFIYLIEFFSVLLDLNLMIQYFQFLILNSPICSFITYFRF